jgi:L-rhamnose mutarotase
MKIKYALQLWFVLLLPILPLVAGCSHQPVKRVGMVTGIRPEKIAEYKALHADSNAGVRDLLGKYHMHNFSIFLQEIDGKWFEFGYYEYKPSSAPEGNVRSWPITTGRLFQADRR